MGMKAKAPNVQKLDIIKIAVHRRGSPGPKIYISFRLIYVIALSFFFPKWGHTLLNYRYFLFYVHLREGGIVKYRGKRTL